VTRYNRSAMEDPLAKYTRQGLTWEKAMAHARTLALQASQRGSQEPDTQFVGIVATPDASEMREIVPTLRQMGQVPDWAYVLVSRDVALGMLRMNHPASLDWLEPKTTGPKRRLPIVVLTPFGTKQGWEPYEVIEECG
jgi:hypothetical protein